MVKTYDRIVVAVYSLCVIISDNGTNSIAQSGDGSLDRNLFL